MLDANALSELEIGELASNPKKFGLPTIEEFAKNPEKYKNMATADELLSQIDKGSMTLNRHVVAHEYYVGPYKCDSLEHAERVMRDSNIVLNTKSMKPEVIDIGAGKCKIRVTFQLPDE